MAGAESADGAAVQTRGGPLVFIDGRWRPVAEATHFPLRTTTGPRPASLVANSAAVPTW